MCKKNYNYNKISKKTRKTGGGKAELMLTIFENTKAGVVRVRWKYFRSDFVWLRRDYYRYTMPVLANELVWGCGFTMFSVIMGHLGSDAVAANSVANILENIIACVCLGIGTGSGILVGNELGRGNPEPFPEFSFCCQVLWF